MKGSRQAKRKKYLEDFIASSHLVRAAFNARDWPAFPLHQVAPAVARRSAAADLAVHFDNGGWHELGLCAQESAASSIRRRRCQEVIPDTNRARLVLFGMLGRTYMCLFFFGGGG
jgi:hypothetical protein